MSEAMEWTKDWFPRLEEYNPNITKDEWCGFVQDETVFDENALITFACILKAEVATCADMAEQFGRNVNFYNNAVWQTGKKIHEKTNCPLSERSESGNRFWPVCCQAKHCNDGRYEFKIRPELREAFEETKVLEGVEVMEKDFMKVEFRKWMENQKKEDGSPYSPNTIDSYCTALKNSPSKLEIEPQYKKSIFMYNDVNEYQEAKDKIFKAPNFDDVNQKAGNQAFKYGMLLYEKFLNKKIKGLPAMPTKNTANYIDLLKNARNIIFHGAPGTGKTFLAKQIAAEMNAETAFVQFHPSYDYTDFVEGLRPTPPNENGQIGFERKDGVFKEFCKKALKNLQDSQKSVEVLEKEMSINDSIENFLEKSIDEKTEFETATGNKFFVIESSENSIFVSIPANEKTSKLSLPKNDLIGLLSSENEITSGGEIKSFFNRKWRTQQDSYIWILYKQIHDLKQIVSAQKVEKIEKKPFVFIIDEINRGDLSKIFGELFYSIDPGYRGRKGSIQTQYQNLIEEGDVFREGFFIPENVYIIGTMNDIDRSVETMDFAFRRRFTFVEIKANENTEMLNAIQDDSVRATALEKMSTLNNAISEIDGFSSAYHIGGAYFLKLNELGGNFGKLWKYHLEPLLKEYLRGTGNEEDKLEELKAAYGWKDENSDEEAETTESSQAESEE